MLAIVGHAERLERGAVFGSQTFRRIAGRATAPG